MFPFKSGEISDLLRSTSYGVLGNEAPADWAGEIDQARALKPPEAAAHPSANPPWTARQALFRVNGLFSEVVFHHRPTRSLMTSDTCFQAEDDYVPDFFTKALARASGVYQRVGAPAMQPLYAKYPRQATDFLNRVLSFDFDMLIPAHVNAPIYPAKRSFREAFSFLLGEFTPV